MDTQLIELRLYLKEYFHTHRLPPFVLNKFNAKFVKDYPDKKWIIDEDKTPCMLLHYSMFNYDLPSNTMARILNLKIVIPSRDMKDVPDDEVIANYNDVINKTISITGDNDIDNILLDEFIRSTNIEYFKIKKMDEKKIAIV